MARVAVFCFGLYWLCCTLLLASTSAYAVDTGFTTSFEPGEPAPETAVQTDAIEVQIGNGPTSPYAAKKQAGYSGLHALHYRSIAAQGRRHLFAVDIPVRNDTVLSWLALPEIIDDDITASTGVCLDLLFDDGSRLSQRSDARDQHGVRINARAQAASKTLYPQQWARKAVQLGKVSGLHGRRIRAIELQFTSVDGKSGNGWIDDIAIASQPRVPVQRPSDHVMTTRGTQSNGTFSRGNNIPATAMPHGFNFWTPVTDAGVLNWLYRWNEHNDDNNRPRLQALAISHQPSPWMGDRQTFQVLPSSARGVPDADRTRRALPFSHDNELARPYTYRVDFDNGIRAELAPSERAAIFRFRFPDSDGANLLFDNVDERGGLTLDAKTQTLRGYTDTRSRLSNGATRLFVFARFDQPWQASDNLQTGRPTGYIKFTPNSNGEVHMRIATSLISIEQAQRNLEQEIGSNDFEHVRDHAQQAWDSLLGRVQVRGANDDQLTTLYSNLYRLYLYPNIAHENVGTRARPDWRHADQSSWDENAPGGNALRTSAAVKPGKVYVNNGFWDTFRTSWPAYALFAPGRAGEMIDGFLQQYRDGGWIARWSSPGYADLMVGTSSDVAFADAWLKGVRGFDPHEAYAAALRNATAIPPVANVGRKGLARSMYRGYADTETHEGMSWTLESALNDFGLAQLGLALATDQGDPAQAQRYREEAEYLRARAATYVTVFDPDTGFFRGRRPDGQWRVPAAEFDPRIWGGDYTEANGWTFGFTAVHDGAGLASLYGGRDGLARKLDAFFSTPETAQATFAGSYGKVIHEMTEARDVRMGMYAHSNQPSHHIPWLYLDAGQPWKTQAITREILQRLYLGSEIGQGYPGDEDNGEMSAWYLFAMLGIYPLRMGAPEYALGAPLFDQASVLLDNGKTLIVIAHNNSRENIYVQSLQVNGKPWNKPWLQHTDIANGATLEFEMGPAPSRWGSRPQDLPPSLTPHGQQPTLLVDVLQPSVDGTATAAPSVSTLLDDNADTTATVTADNTIPLRTKAGAKPVFYTLTSGGSPIPSASWILEARAGAGAWTELDRRQEQSFTWAHQLRPFRIARRDGDWREYRLRLLQPQRIELAEIELLSSQAKQPHAPSRWGIAPGLRPSLTIR